MTFDPPLMEGTLLRRYKRFLADIRLAGGEVVTAHCANSGSMTGCADPGSPVLLRPTDNPARRLKYDWELVRIGKGWVGINTHRANGIVREAVEARRVPGLRDWKSIRSEVKYGRNSRVDMYLETQRGPYYLEVKNVTLVEDGSACFPDAVTKRGKKHNEELTRVVREGGRAGVFFLVNRGDSERFRPAWEIDPQYGESLLAAREAGVDVFCWSARISPRGIEADKPLIIDLRRTRLKPEKNAGGDR